MTLTKEIIEAAEKDFQFVADVVEGTSDTVLNPRTGKYDKSVKYVIDSIDWSYVGKFADGVTFTKKTDFAIDADGTQWIYTGSLPFSATAGTVPNEPTYQVVHVSDHNQTTNRNAVGAHDQIYRRKTTVAEIESGVFSVGDILEVSDRANAPFNVVAGGTPNGFNILDAGNGNTAVYTPSDKVSKDAVGSTNSVMLYAKDNDKLSILLGSGDAIITPVLIPSLAEIEGTNSALGTSGGTVDGYNTISKTGTETVLLDNTDPNTPAPWTVDCIVYLDPEFKNNAYPQGSKLTNVALKGTGTTEVGLAVFQGSINTENLQVDGCIEGFKSQNSWSSRHNGMRVYNGAISFGEGTSQSLNQCAAKGHASIRGAFNFDTVTYSNLRCCTSDSSENGAFVFSDVSGITITSCGNESASVVDSDVGQALTFDQYCYAHVDGYFCVPSETSDHLIYVGNNCDLQIDNFIADGASKIYTGADIFIAGNNNHVKVKGYRSYQNGVRKQEPVVHMATSGASGSRVTVELTNGNRKKYYPSSTESAPNFEYENESGSFTPNMYIGGTEVTTYAVASGSYKKNGDTVTAQFTLNVSDLGGGVGGVTIGLGTLTDTLVPISTNAINMGYVDGVAANNLHGNISTSTKLISVQKDNGTTGSTALLDTDLTASVVLIGTITFTVNSQFTTYL
jgi:hypothetical protein